MIFEDRKDAGRQLAQLLCMLADRDDTLVLGIPRGGVPVAFEVAEALHAPLDVFLSRKLGVPGHEELAFGAVAVGGGVFLDQEIVRAARITPEEVARVTARTEAELRRQTEVYRSGRAALSVEGKAVVLVDDGVATGSSLYAAVCSLKALNPGKLVVGVPVASRSAYARLQPDTDMFVAVQAPRSFSAVGQFYCDFRPTSDDAVISLLRARQGS